AGVWQVVVTVEVTGLRIAEIEIAISELDREIVRDPIGEARIERPSEAPLAGVIGIRVAHAQVDPWACINVDVAKIADGVAAEADAGADEGRKPRPSAEIDIAIQQERQFGLAAGVPVGRIASAIMSIIQTVEIRFAAILAGDINSEPIVDVVADAD